MAQETERREQAEQAVRLWEDWQRNGAAAHLTMADAAAVVARRQAAQKTAAERPEGRKK